MVLSVSKFFKVLCFCYHSFMFGPVFEGPKNVRKTEILVRLENAMLLTFFFFLFTKLMLIINFGFGVL